MTDEAVILAGGFGTRLRPVISDVPKPLAPVADHPFLEYLLRYLRHHGIGRVVLSIGYKGELIRESFGNSFAGVDLAYVQETEPLGTGGGIRLALKQCLAERIVVLNGDSFFDVDLASLARLHRTQRADASLALRKVADTSRFGTIELLGSRVCAFREKPGEASGPGLINGGVYLLDRKRFLDETTDDPFSVERDFFVPGTGRLNFHGLICTGYFIDIGVPEDYQRAQHELVRFAY